MDKIDNMLKESSKKIEEPNIDAKSIYDKACNSKKKSSIRSRKPLIPALICILIIPVLIFTIATKNKYSRGKGTHSNTTINKGENDYNINDKIMHIIGEASIKVFEKNKGLDNNVIKFMKFEKTDGYSYTEYPFKTLCIANAKKISIEITESDYDESLDIIKEKCGLGTLEVIIFNYGVYEGDNRIAIAGDEKGITIKGEKGTFTLLQNSMSVDENITKYGFSSHIKFTNKGIEKDETPPIYNISYVSSIENNNEYISFEKREKGFFDSSVKPNNINYYFNSDDFIYSNREYIYSAELEKEIERYPRKSIEVDVIKWIDSDKSDIIAVNYNEINYSIHIQPHTYLATNSEEIIEINDENITKLKEAEKLIVSYYEYKENYIPKVINVESIIFEID